LNYAAESFSYGGIIIDKALKLKQAQHLKTYNTEMDSLREAVYERNYTAWIRKRCGAGATCVYASKGHGAAGRET
jgi:hypothetical protein